MANGSEQDLSEVNTTDRFNLTDHIYLITAGGRGVGFVCAKPIAQLSGGVAVIDTLWEPVDDFHTLAKRFGVTDIVCSLRCDEP